MRERDFDAIARDVERLKRENLWLKRAGLVVVAGLLIFAGIGLACGQKNGTVEAEKFVLTDEEGNPKALLETREEGTFLRMMDAEGRDRLSIKVTPEGEPLINLVDQAGTNLVTVGARNNGTGAIGIADALGITRVAIATLPDGYVGIALTDIDGNAVWSAP